MRQAMRVSWKCLTAWAALAILAAPMLGASGSVQVTSYFPAPVGEYEEFRSEQAIFGAEGPPAPKPTDTLTLYGSVQFNSIVSVGPKASGSPPGSTAPHGLSIRGTWVDPEAFTGGGALSGSYQGQPTERVIALPFRPRRIEIIGRNPSSPGDYVEAVILDRGVADGNVYGALYRGTSGSGVTAYTYFLTQCFRWTPRGFAIKELLNLSPFRYVYIVYR